MRDPVVGAVQHEAQHLLLAHHVRRPLDGLDRRAPRAHHEQEPVEVVATIPDAGKDDPRFKEVEPAMHYTLTFPGGVEARCKTAYNANLGTMLKIVGERGTILMFPAFMYWGNRMTIERDGKIEVITKPNIDTFAAEMDDFSRSILDDRPSPTPGKEGLRDMLVIEALYRSAAENRPVKL